MQPSVWKGASKRVQEKGKKRQVEYVCEKKQEQEGGRERTNMKLIA